jgi:hypothetical protein
VKPYGPWITLTSNRKMGGVLIDLDTVKGCGEGMAANPRGCYGACYAARAAKFRGIDFRVSVVRKFKSEKHAEQIVTTIRECKAQVVRIGTAGDPSHDWEHTVAVCEKVAPAGKPIVVITKHWHKATDQQFARLVALGVVLNTSVSPLDRPTLREHRVVQYGKYRGMGGHSCLRVVTIAPTDTSLGQGLARIQADLLRFPYVIDNPLRAYSTTLGVAEEGFRLTAAEIHSGHEVKVSLHSADVYLGSCKRCRELCGVQFFEETRRR